MRYVSGPVEQTMVALLCGTTVVAVARLARGESRRIAVPAGSLKVRAQLGTATVVRDVEAVIGERREVVELTAPVNDER